MRAFGLFCSPDDLMKIYVIFIPANIIYLALINLDFVLAHGGCCYKICIFITSGEFFVSVY